MNLTTLIKELEEKAKAATPGPWEHNADGIRCTYQSRRDENWRDWIGLKIVDMPVVGQSELNAEYVALCSPENILALVKALEEAKELAEKIKTLSVRANTFGPGMPETYADATWMLGQEARAFLSKWVAPVEGEK